MKTEDQLSFLTEAEFMIIPRYAYIEYKRLQSIEKELKPIKLGEVDRETFLMRCALLKAYGLVEHRSGWFRKSAGMAVMTNKELKTCDYDYFMSELEKLNKETE